MLAGDGQKDQGAKSKFGSVKFKISFMRGQFFKDHQLSDVLFTRKEQERQEKEKKDSLLVEIPIRSKSTGRSQTVKVADALPFKI